MRSKSILLKTCLVCGTDFQPSKSRVFLCSNACKWAWLSRRSSRNCEHCGMSFDARRTDIERGRARFCSRACGAIHRHPPERERFWAKVIPGENGCLLWTGALSPRGYGNFKSSSLRTHLAHAVAYIWANGSIPTGLKLDHLCRVRNCVNPDHLEPVTQAENKRRAAAVRTTCPKGHPYDFVDAKGARRCSICVREHARHRNKAWKERKRAREER